MYCFSSVEQLDHDMDIFSDDELIGIAVIACNDMQTVYHQKPWTKRPFDRELEDEGRRPAVMTVIAQGERLLRGSHEEGFYCVEWASTICDLTFAGLVNLIKPDRYPFQILRIVLKDPVEVDALIVQYYTIMMAIMHTNLRPLESIELQTSA